MGVGRGLKGSAPWDPPLDTQLGLNSIAQFTFPWLAKTDVHVFNSLHLCGINIELRLPQEMHLN